MLSGIVREGSLVWEESGAVIPYYPGSYFSPPDGDNTWRQPPEDVTKYYNIRKILTHIF